MPPISVIYYARLGVRKISLTSLDPSDARVDVPALLSTGLDAARNLDSAMSKP